MIIDEQCVFYPTGAAIAHLLLCDVQIGSTAIDRYCMPAKPIRHLPEADRRVYDRTFVRHRAGRRKMTGKRIV